ncbi:titin-like [Hexamita inflata]|uniref:Titin-like n=1 Tax=Hexamita inflata TaxID=28002 RepID=A0ABP1HP44_9EUKA
MELMNSYSNNNESKKMKFEKSCGDDDYNLYQPQQFTRTPDKMQKPVQQPQLENSQTKAGTNFQIHNALEHSNGVPPQTIINNSLHSLEMPEPVQKKKVESAFKFHYTPPSTSVLLQIILISTSFVQCLSYFLHLFFHSFTYSKFWFCLIIILLSLLTSLNQVKIIRLNFFIQKNLSIMNKIWFVVGFQVVLIQLFPYQFTDSQWRAVSVLQLLSIIGVVAEIVYLVVELKMNEKMMLTVDYEKAEKDVQNENVEVDELKNEIKEKKKKEAEEKKAALIKKNEETKARKEQEAEKKKQAQIEKDQQKQIEEAEAQQQKQLKEQQKQNDEESAKQKKLEEEALKQKQKEEADKKQKEDENKLEEEKRKRDEQKKQEAVNNQPKENDPTKPKELEKPNESKEEQKLKKANTMKVEKPVIAPATEPQMHKASTLAIKKKPNKDKESDSSDFEI